MRELPDVGPENAAKAVFAHRAQDLLDAIGFRSTLTDVEHDSERAVRGFEEPGCTCGDCLRTRARGWYAFNGWEVEEIDDNYLCICCGNEHGTEREALLCCYDDEEWVEFCRDNDIPIV